jgi:membrane protease YdiL (CAAX protease family)
MHNEDIVEQHVSDPDLEKFEGCCDGINPEDGAEGNSRLFFAAGFIMLSVILSPFVSQALLALDSLLKFPMIIKVLFGALFLQGMFVLGIVLSFLVISNKNSNWKEQLYLHNWKHKYLVISPLGAVVIFLPLMGVSYISMVLTNYLKKILGSEWSLIFGPKFKIQQYFLTMEWRYFLIFVIAAVIVAPVVEEIAFRNLIFRTLNTKLGIGASVFLTSFIFAAVHLNIENIPSIFLLGVTFQLLYIRYKSVYPSIIFHLTFNGISMLFLTIVKFFGPRYFHLIS